MPALTHKPQGKAKRLTEAERMIIHMERVKGGKTTRQIAKEYDVSHPTVTAIEHDKRLKDKLEKADHIKKALTANLYISAQESLDCITPGRLKKVNAYQNAIIAATCIDKALLIERGSPPASVNQIQVNVQLTQLQDEIQAMVSKASSG